MIFRGRDVRRVRYSLPRRIIEGVIAKLPYEFQDRATRDGDSRFSHPFLDANPQANSRLSLDAFVLELMVSRTSNK